MSTADRGPTGVLRALVTEIQEKNITFLAASLAYYAFASLIPLLLLAISIATLVGGQQLADRIIEAAGGALPRSVADIITQTLSSSGAAGASIGIGLVFLLWSAIKIFRGMDIAFSEVYGASGPDGIVDQVTDALITLLGIVLAIVVTIVIGAVVSFVQQTSGVLAQFGLGFLQDGIGYAAGLVSIVGLAIAFYPLYYFLPADDVGFKEAIPGALFAAIGWTLLQTFFRLYAGQSGSSAYGIIGAALLILTFLYFGGMIILIGAALNAVLAGRVESARSGAASEDGSETDPGSRDSSRGDSGSDLQQRIKERTQTIIDDSEDGSGTSGSESDGSGETDRENQRPITDGGVEREVEDEREAEREQGIGRADEVDEDERRREPISDEEPGESDDTAEPRRPEAATATTLGGSEYTLSEEYSLQREIERLRAEVDAFEMEVEDRVVDRDELEDDLQSYVRSRVRSGKARGWGPYLVLLYGTIMTVAIAFGDALIGGWALAAIIVIFLSTLGLYVLMVLVGLGLSALAVPGKVRRTVESIRS
jgi:YihY family inner membrane protein